MTTEFITFLTVIVGFLYQAWREWRKERRQDIQRQWDLEDRVQLAMRVAETKRATLHAIAENTVITNEAKQEAQKAFTKGEEAWTEANNLTDKFTKLVEVVQKKDVV